MNVEALNESENFYQNLKMKKLDERTFIPEAGSVWSGYKTEMWQYAIWKSRCKSGDTWYF